MTLKEMKSNKEQHAGANPSLCETAVLYSLHCQFVSSFDYCAEMVAASDLGLTYRCNTMSAQNAESCWARRNRSINPSMFGSLQVASSLYYPAPEAKLYHITLQRMRIMDPLAIRALANSK